MGQKVNPVGFRVGVFRDWDARWFARKSYGDMLAEDIKIRKYLAAHLDKAEVARVEIEKAGDGVKVIIHTGKPGVVIGKKGQDIENLRSSLSRLISKPSVEVSVQEVKKPEFDANIVAQNIAEQIERRVNYKQAMKRAAANTMRAQAEGIKICCAGRLAGAEIAREEWVRTGRVPLHTLRSDIDYGFAQAKTKYGIIGVKVWICRGNYAVSANV